METSDTFSTTADVGIRIHGYGYTGLFQSAIKGLNLVYFSDWDDDWEPKAPAPVQRLAFEYYGDSCENILVNLLSEAIYLLQKEKKITAGIDVKEAGETHLKADLLTIPCTIQPELEIKSVTYHNLKVIDKNGIKYAEIIFDV
ncbi:MAG: archease [Acidobacteria bacterium]|jgi:SHS2 domain-containing protein|nr:archease [Acidobacteriota bacterium]